MFFHCQIRAALQKNALSKGQKQGYFELCDALQVYQRRFVAERTFAWADKFKRLLIRFERYDAHFLGAHYLAFTMINLRHVIAQEVASEDKKDQASEERTHQC